MIKMDEDLNVDRLGVIDVGVLAEVCRGGLERYPSVPFRGLIREYNSRSKVVHVRFIPVKTLELAMRLVPEGCIYYHKDGIPWGIRRDYHDKRAD